MAQEALTPLASALGRMPCGLYIVSTAGPEGPLGFLGSFVAQVGLDPPTVCVAVGKDRAHLGAMRQSGRFNLSILDGESSGLMTPFFKPPAEGSPFDGMGTRDVGGAPVLTQALAWLSCRVTGEHATGDHVVVFGEVEEGELQREGDPKVHLRRNGLGY